MAASRCSSLTLFQPSPRPQHTALLTALRALAAQCVVNQAVCAEMLARSGAAAGGERGHRLATSPLLPR